MYNPDFGGRCYHQIKKPLHYPRIIVAKKRQNDHVKCDCEYCLGFTSGKYSSVINGTLKKYNRMKTPERKLFICRILFDAVRRDDCQMINKIVSSGFEWNRLLPGFYRRRSTFKTTLIHIACKYRKPNAVDVLRKENQVGLYGNRFKWYESFRHNHGES